MLYKKFHVLLSYLEVLSVEHISDRLKVNLVSTELTQIVYFSLNKKLKYSLVKDLLWVRFFVSAVTNLVLNPENDIFPELLQNSSVA